MASKGESSEKKYPNKQCAHNECLGHAPDLENVGEKKTEPNPGLFGIKTYWGNRHCGKGMIRYKVSQQKRCKKCGRDEESIEQAFGICSCCNYPFYFKVPDQKDKK